MTTIHTRSRHLGIDTGAVRLDRSPLKDARHAFRTVNMADNEPSVCMDPDPSFEDEILLSPKKGSSSNEVPSKKRALESDDEDGENRLQGIQNRSHSVAQSSKQPKRSKRSKVASSAATLPALFARQRQKSASSSLLVSEPSSSKPHAQEQGPRINAQIAPLLDLNLVPPSPRKAIAPEPLALTNPVRLNEEDTIDEKVASVNVEEEVSSVSSEEKATVDQLPPPSSSPPPTVDADESEEMGLESQPARVDSHPASTEQMDVEASGTDHASSAEMPPPPLPARFLQQQLLTPVSQTRTWKPGQRPSVSVSFPMSPLTPLPPTPAVGLKRKVEDIPSTSSSSETPIAESSRKKSITPAPRMTRAATLRQQKVQQQRLASESTSTARPTPRKDVDAGEPQGDNEASGSRGRSTSRTLTSSTVASRARSVTRTDDESSKSRRSTTCPPPDSPEKEKRAPSLPSFTFSSKIPQTPSKQPDSVTTSPKKTFKLTLPSSLGGPSSLNLSPKKGIVKPGGETALSALSRALAKLAVPPPPKPSMQSRPSTSLGFSRDSSAPPTSRSLGQMPPPPALPPSRAGSAGDIGKGKGKMSASLSNPAAKSGPFASSTTRTPSFAAIPSNSRLGQGGNPFSRPLQKLQHARIKASKVTSLETVQGSPVKAGSSSTAEIDEDEEIYTIADDDKSGGFSSSSQAAGSSSSDPIQNSDEPPQSDSTKPIAVGSSSSSDPVENTSADNSQSEKEMKQISKLNASRRASMAFSALERSMREQGVGLGRPSMSPGSSSFADKSNGSLTSPKDPSLNLSGGKPRSTSATFTTSSGRTVRPPAQFRSFTAAVSSAPSPSSNALGRTRSHPTIPVSSPPEHGAESSSRSPFDFDSDDRSSDAESGAGSGPRKRPKKMPGSLSILDGCTIFVDVRTEEGEDASALFVDMLQGLGAKILTRGVGQTCTHVVYKNGLASTIAKVRLMDAETRPRVVGIGWVVECAEKREQADESKFIVEIEGLHVAGASKRRKSVMPQPMAITTGPMDAFMEFSRLNKGGDSSGSAKENGSMTLVDSMDDRENTNVEGGSKLPSKLTPLEVARRRGTTGSRPT